MLFRGRLEASPRYLYILVAYGRFTGNLKDVRGVISGSRKRGFLKRGIELGNFHQAFARQIVASRAAAHIHSEPPEGVSSRLSSATGRRGASNRKSTPLARRSVRSDADLPIDCSRDGYTYSRPADLAIRGPRDLVIGSSANPSPRPPRCAEAGWRCQDSSIRRLRSRS